MKLVAIVAVGRHRRPHRMFIRADVAADSARQHRGPCSQLHGDDRSNPISIGTTRNRRDSTDRSEPNGGTNI